jgi:hypothetical protein
MIVRGRCHRGFNSPLFACTAHPRIPSPIARLPALNLVTHVNQYRAAHGQHGTNPRESPAPNVIISSKTNKDHLLRTLQPLLLENGGKWQLGNDAKSLERMFKFKTFSKAWVSLILHYFENCIGMIVINSDLGVHGRRREGVYASETSPGMVECRDLASLCVLLRGTNSLPT